jgi:hypothetical protein
MIAEIDLYGVFVPTLLLLVLVTMPVAGALRMILSRIGAYRFVWHRPLFDLAIFVMLLWCAVMATSKWVFT